MVFDCRTPATYNSCFFYLGMKTTVDVLKDYKYEELCELKQDNLIGWSLWVKAQPEVFDDYEEWLQINGKEDDDKNANLYVSWKEKSIMGTV